MLSGFYMATKTTLVEIKHDVGYGENLLEYLNISLRGKDMIGVRVVDSCEEKKAKVTDRERAIDTLQRLFDFAWSEQHIANQQAQEAREVKDFRAMDRHASYASAMQKMQQRVNSFARNLYMHDVTTARETTI